MAKSNNTLCLDKFYPEKDLMITDIDQQSDKIINSDEINFKQL
mgnify:CR=1 FL=1